MTKEEIVRRILLQIILVKIGGNSSVSELINDFSEFIQKSDIDRKEKKWLSNRRLIVKSLQALLNEGRLQRSSVGLKITPEAKNFALSDLDFIAKNNPEYELAA